jgi:hypothetical protein
MSGDSYHTVGATQDRERTWRLMESQAASLKGIRNALERIASLLERDEQDRLAEMEADEAALDQRLDRLDAQEAEEI